MHFEGRELISKGTRGTSRILLTSSFTLLLVYYAVDDQADSATLGGVEFQLNHLKFAGRAMIAFLMLNHIISWVGDCLSYLKWNTAEKVHEPADGGSSSRSSLEFAISKIKWCIQSLEGNIRASTVEEVKVKEIKEDIESIQKVLVGIKSEIDQLDKFAKFVLFVWFLAVPVIISFVAIFQPQLSSLTHYIVSAFC